MHISYVRGTLLLHLGPVLSPCLALLAVHDVHGITPVYPLLEDPNVDCAGYLCVLRLELKRRDCDAYDVTASQGPVPPFLLVIPGPCAARARQTGPSQAVPSSVPLPRLNSHVRRQATQMEY